MQNAEEVLKFEDIDEIDYCFRNSQHSQNDERTAAVENEEENLEKEHDVYNDNVPKFVSGKTNNSTNTDMTTEKFEEDIKNDIVRNSLRSQNGRPSANAEKAKKENLEKDSEVNKDVDKYDFGECVSSTSTDSIDITTVKKDSYEKYELQNNKSQKIFDVKASSSKRGDYADENNKNFPENFKIDCHKICKSISKYLLDFNFADLLHEENVSHDNNRLSNGIINPELNGLDLKNFQPKMIPRNCLPTTFKNPISAFDEAQIAKLYHRVYSTQYLWKDQQCGLTSTDPKNIWAYKPKQHSGGKKDYINTNILELEHISRCFGGQYMKEVQRALYGKKPNDPPSGSPEYFQAAQNYALYGDANIGEESIMFNAMQPDNPKSYKILNNVVNKKGGYSSHAPTSSQPFRYLDNVVNKKGIHSNPSTSNKTITFTELSMTKTTVSSNRLHLKAVNNFCQSVNAINSSYNQHNNVGQGTSNHNISEIPSPIIAMINNENSSDFEIGKRALAEKAYMAFYINQKNPQACSNTMHMPQCGPSNFLKVSSPRVSNFVVCHNNLRRATSVPPGFSSPPPVFNIPETSKITVKTTQVQYYHEN